MCDAAAAGMGVALVRLKLGAPWLENGTLVRLYATTCPARTPTTCAGAPAPWSAGNARRLPSGCKKMA
jgi:DNA-binding transcriptional LysR family regulator